jgi:hypothetical protein
MQEKIKKPEDKTNACQNKKEKKRRYIIVP